MRLVVKHSNRPQIVHFLPKPTKASDAPGFLVFPRECVRGNSRRAASKNHLENGPKSEGGIPHEARTDAHIYLAGKLALS